MKTLKNQRKLSTILGCNIGTINPISIFKSTVSSKRGLSTSQRSASKLFSQRINLNKLWHAQVPFVKIEGRTGRVWLWESCKKRFPNILCRNKVLSSPARARNCPDRFPGSLTGKKLRDWPILWPEWNLLKIKRTLGLSQIIKKMSILNSWSKISKMTSS